MIPTNFSIAKRWKIRKISKEWSMKCFYLEPPLERVNNPSDVIRSNAVTRWHSLCKLPHPNPSHIRRGRDDINAVGTKPSTAFGRILVTLGGHVRAFPYTQSSTVLPWNYTFYYDEGVDRKLQSCTKLIFMSQAPRRWRSTDHRPLFYLSANERGV